VISTQQLVAPWIFPSMRGTVIQFLCAESARSVDIHSQMKHVYDDDCLQHIAVFDWSTRFKQGRSSTKDLGRPGRPPHIRDPDNNVKVEQMVLCDHHVMVQHISMEYVHHIVTQVLAYWMVSALWVLKSLNEKQKATHVGVCLEHLLQYGKEGDEFLECTVRGDESWCLHCDPETKCMNQQWEDCHPHN
jgi:hypothetical protein